MKQIELYDIITLDNDEEYTVLKILQEEGKTYYLLAWIDEDEEPDMERIKIVEQIQENNKLEIEEITDEKLLKKLSKLFLESLKGILEDN